MTRPTHIVALGASAGGLEALSEFFDHLPPTDRLAFVVLQHLSPDHKSYMVDLLQKHTTLAVRQAEEGQEVEAGVVYHIQPGKVLTIADGRLHAEPQRDRRGMNLPIDVFFRSLAAERGPDAVAIVLSGTGSDGTAGVRAIKEAGGLVIVQDEGSCRFDGMPRSAVATGVADLVARPGEIPDALLKALAHPRIGLPEDDGAASVPVPAGTLESVIRLLNEHTGVDFSGYKPSTVVRRLERRMGIRHCAGLDAYLALMREQPAEADVLRKELLIGVTQFFRDPEAWEVLRREVIPAVFAANQGNREIRVWVAACSTGEEAYSIAMLLHEQREASGQNYRIKVFATDIDRAAIETASIGLYPFNIVADLTRERLERFFIRRPEGFQVASLLRESVVFAPHDLIHDPPFTRMDLTTCRNMLIYLQTEPQERVLGLLNFSLKPNGFLFLGSSESPSCLGPQLQPVNGRWRVYQATGARRQPVGIAPVRPEATSRWRESPARARTSAADQLLERVHQELVKDLDVRCLVVDVDGHLAHSFGEVGRYLRMSSGPVDTRIASLLTPGLAEAVSGALRVAQREGKDVTIERVLTADQQVDVRIKPVRLAKPEGHYFFVYLLGGTKVAPSASTTAMDQDEISQLRVEHLEEKLHQTQASLQSTIEELETSNEELQATNEELVSANEELQSTNEELQSLNEELYTVNSELQVKIAEVSRANSDMNNLLAGANVATLFLEQSLNIRRFTPAAGQLLNLLDRDLGRPFVHIATTLRGGDLVDMAAKTAMHAAQHRTELRHDDGRHFLVTVMPYRTARGDDDGVVLTFVDISDLKRSAARAQEAETRYQALTEHLPNGITVIYDRALAIIDASGPGLRLLGREPATLVGQPVAAVFTAEGDALRAGLSGVFAGRTEQAVCRLGGRDLLVTLLPVGDGAAAHGMAVAQDITSLRSSLARLAHG